MVIDHMLVAEHMALMNSVRELLDLLAAERVVADKMKTATIWANSIVAERVQIIARAEQLLSKR